MKKPLDKLDDYYYKEEIINNTMHYSYLLITNQITFDELLDIQSTEGFGLIFDPYDPDIDEQNIIDTLLDHFIHLEEYEKCQDLIDLKKEKK
tara:strand:+ start:2816 stop:3091 length:276 start_codon:yes stop_codon:yes gene_type:complete